MSAQGGGSFLDTLLLGIKRIARGFSLLPQRPTLNFIGFPLVVDNPSMGTTDVYAASTGSSGSSGIVLVENNGAAMPFEPTLNFVGFTLGDDPSNQRTNVALPSAGTTDVPHGGTGQTSLTSHAVVLGEGTSPVGFAVPTSSGFVLTDRGPGLDPTFQAPSAGLPSGTGFVVVTSGVGGTLSMPLPVADGGTGDSSLTIHAVLLGRGTSAVAFATATSTGFVLTDNGPGSDPSFQPPSGGFPSPTSTDTSLTFDPGSFTSSPHLGWQSKRPVFNIRSFGAVGGNPTLDTAGLAQAIAAASSGGDVFIPAGYVFQINAEQTVSASIRITGDVGSVLQASGAIRSFFRLQAPCQVSGLTLDGNSLASYGIIFNGAQGSEVSGCNFINLLNRAVRSAGYQTATVITPVSHTGGGPSLTLIQPDTLALMLGGDVWIKITNGGATGTAKFQYSPDGVTYTSVDQVLYTTTPIGQVSPPLLSTDAGIALQASGTYVLGAVYRWSMAIGSLGFNYNCRVLDCIGNTNGVIYASSGLVAQFPGGPAQSVSGSATWTAGSPVVQFSGLPFDLTTLGLKDGDAIRLAGARFQCTDTARPHRDVGTIAMVLGPSQLYLDAFDLPTVNGTSADFAIIRGGVAYTDPITGPYNDMLSVVGGVWRNQANGVRDGALNAGNYDTHVESWGVCWNVGLLSSD